MSEFTVKVIVVALIGAVLLGSMLAWMVPPQAPETPLPHSGGPAPWEVSAVLEEARNITRDASQ
jgi:hypothetical protein